MKKAWGWLRREAKSPVNRPLEVWALRALLGYAAAKLGVDLAGKA